MEIELADQEGLALDFESIFDEADLFDNQIEHTPSKQHTETEGNISSQENVELGSSCGSNNNDQQPLMMTNNQPAISTEENENLTVVSAFTSSSTIELLDVLEDDPTLEALLMGTPNNLPVIGTPQHDYFKDIINSDHELGASNTADDCDRGQVDAQNQSLDPSRHVNAQSNNGFEEISSLPPLVNGLDPSRHINARSNGFGGITSVPPLNVNSPNFQQLGTLSSFNPVLPGPPQQYPPLLDQYAGSSAGNNWSNNVNYANPINDQNLNMQPSLINSSSSFQFPCSNPSIGMNGRDTRSPFLNATPPLLQHTMGLSTMHAEGVVQSFGRENHHEPNLICNSYQYPNANYPENVPHQVLNRHIPLQYGTIINNQVVQNNNTNNNLIINGMNHQHQSSLYPTNSIFPPNTMITGLGVVNQVRPPINPQQQAIFAPQLLNNGANYRPLAANILNSPGYNWCQQLSSQHQQINSQVPSMANVVNYDPNCQYSMQPAGYSTPLRPQNISYHHQVPVPPTLYNPPVFNSMLQSNHQVPNFNPRPPQLPYNPFQQLNNEIAAVHYNSIMPASSMSSRISPALRDGQLNKKSPVMPIGVLDSQPYSNFNIAPHQRSFASSSAEPSTLSRRFMCNNNQRQLALMPNATDSDHLRGSILPRTSLLSSSQTENRLVVNGATRSSGGLYGTNSPSLNSQTEKQEGVIKRAGLAIANQKNRASPTKARGTTTLGRRGRTRDHTKQQEVGQSSISSKRFRREVVGRKEITDLPAPSVKQKVSNLETSQPQENNEAVNSNVSNQPITDSRKNVQNAVYDPLYEGLGLAVDPHLRLFAST